MLLFLFISATAAPLRAQTEAGEQSPVNMSAARGPNAGSRALRGHALGSTALLGVPWSPLAPQTQTTAATGAAGGRILSIAVDPADATGNTVFIGSDGGIFKSTNAASLSGSVSFAPVSDGIPAVDTARNRLNVVSVGAVSVQPGNTGVVLAGTGDPSNVSDAIYGNGLLRSTDGGNSWTAITGPTDPSTGLTIYSFFGEAVSGFAWSTVTPNLVVAAVTTAPGGYAANAGYEAYSVTGLFYSQDAGKTWRIATVENGPGQVTASSNNPGGAIVLSVVWNPVRQMFLAAIRNHGFYASPDGITWTRMAAQPGTALTTLACPWQGSGASGCPIYNAALTVQPGSGDTFAIATDQNGVDSGLWQDVCAPAAGKCLTAAPVFGKQIADTALENGGGAIAGAGNAFSLAAIASGNDTLLFAGAQDLYRCSLAAGCSWRNATNVTSATCPSAAQVAPMQHAIAASTGAAPLLYFATDRGVWRSRDLVNEQAACSTDDARHFDNLNATLGSLTEITALGQDPADANQLMAGAGASGTFGGASGAWQLTLPGPGGYAEAGWGATAGFWFATSGAGVSISSCALGDNCGVGSFGAPVIGNSQVSGDGTALHSPAVWAIDPADPSRMLVATCRVWRGLADGTNWGSANALSGMLDGSPAPACQSGNTQIRALAASGAIPGQSIPHERLYAGLAGFPDGALTHPGRLFSALVMPSSTAASTTWSDLTGSPVTNDFSDSNVFNPGEVGISAIALDPTVPQGTTLYVTLSAYSGQGLAESANVPTVYGSSDAGQHWANLTDNLPNVPVNAVLVDPEDPAIVYVGTDAGVFVTTSVAQCADPSQYCWSIYGAGLPPVRVTTLNTVDSSGEKWLRVGTKGRGVWQAELASTAIQNQTASASLTPATLSFAAQAVGTESVAQTLTVRNTGGVALTLGSPAVSNSDFLAASQCPASLVPGASCTIAINFAPTATGTRSAALTVAANVQGGVLTASLAGTGTTGATIVLTPLRMDFGTMRIGQTSATQYLTVANTGTATSTLSSIRISGPFALTANICGATLAPNYSCTVGVSFTPTASGAASGSLVVSDDSGAQTALLSGTGQSAPTDTPSTLSLSFGPQTLGTTSAAQQVTLTNSGDSALTGIAASITGDFALKNLCGNALAGHSSCALSVVYSPTAVGAETGHLTVQDANGAETVALSGTGTAPPAAAGVSATASPLTIDFGTQGIASISAPQTLTLINTGTSALSGIAAAASAGFNVANNACNVTVAAGASCTMQITFAPQSAGAQSGAVQLTAAGLAAPVNVPLTGMGADFQLAVQGASSSTVTGGNSATYQLLLTPVGASAGQVAFTCTGLPAGSTCSTNPASVTMAGTGATATIQVTITTAAASAGLHMPPNAPPGPGSRGGAAVGLALASLVLWRRRDWPRALRGCSLLLLGAVCLALSGCGLSINGGSGGTGTGTGGGSQGVFTLTVGGTAPGVTHTVSLNLTIE